MLEKEKILKELKQKGDSRVKLAITDVDGILRGKYVNIEKFTSAVEKGFGFCNVVFGWDSADECYDNSSYTGWHTGYPDAEARIDLNTFRRIPWDDNVPFFLADFWNESGKPLEVCPRQVLRKVIDYCNDAGFEPTVGLEYEFVNFRESPQSLAEKSFVNPEPLTPGMFGYSISRSSLSQPYFSALCDQLTEFNIPLEGIHIETGPGVYEASIQHSGALEAADRGVLFKTAVKEIAYRYDILPSFMAKWNAKLPGCSGHIHQSLWSTRTGENVFYDESDPMKMSDVFRHFLAGQMELMPEILPMLVPNVNSYKRLVEGLWAPTTVTWGCENRTSAFRVIPGSANSTRLETRVGGADMNAYLSVAASLASGVWGVKNKLELKSSPVKGNAYAQKDAVRLPDNLIDATRKFSESEIARELFGPAFVEHFAASREWEWRQFQRAVTNWETERYLEII